MALDFPSNPINGQVYGNYYFDSNINAWSSLASLNLPSAIKNTNISTVSSTLVPLTVTGYAGQSTNLQEWKNSSGSTLSSISQAGALTLATPLAVSSGGTGAIDAATARTNLAITPANIGATPISGSVVQVQGVTTGTTLAGTLSGTELTSFTFTPKYSNSRLLLQSSAVNIGEYNNVDNEFHMSAYRDGNFIATARGTAGHFHFSGSLNIGWHSFNHIFNSWGTTAATISIKVGNSSSMYANYPYYTNNYTSATAAFSITEIAA